MSYAVETTGVFEVITALKKVEGGILDLRELGTWDYVQSGFYQVQKEIFDSEGSASKGGKWKELSSPYKEIKEARYGAQKILQREGGMYREFTSDTGNVTKTADEMTFEFSLPAAYHMSRDPRKKMPLRSSLELTDAQIKSVVTDRVAQKIRQLGDNARLQTSKD